MILFMRYNNYTSDPFALFAGCSGPNPAGSIANRLDLGGGECVYRHNFINGFISFIF